MAKYLGHVLFVGDSNMLGVGDEMGQLGFSGRSIHHYGEYWREAKKTESECIEVLPWLDAQRTRDLISYAPYVGNVVKMAATNPLSGRWAERRVGVFSAGYFYNGRLKESSERDITRQWCRSLDALRDTCRGQDIAPIVVEGPSPIADASFDNGARPASELLERINAITREHTASWASYVACDSLLDTPREAFIADQFHMNASGYERVTPFLVELINKELGIEFPYPVEALV